MLHEDKEKFKEDKESEMIVAESIADEDESFEEKPFRVRGCFLSAVERLDEEFTKVTQCCGFSSPVAYMVVLHQHSIQGLCNNHLHR